MHTSTHTLTRRHTHTRLLFSRWSSICAALSHDLSRPRVFQPLSPVVHASLMPSSPQISPHAIYYVSTRGSPTNINLFTFLPDAQIPGCPPPTLQYFITVKICLYRMLFRLNVGCPLDFVTPQKPSKLAILLSRSTTYFFITDRFDSIQLSTRQRGRCVREDTQTLTLCSLGCVLGHTLWY